MAEHHSEGWVLLPGSPSEDPRTLPNPHAPPPSPHECVAFLPVLDRVKRFYAEGEEKQMHTRQALLYALDLYSSALSRVDAQMLALQRHPSDHPTRRRLEMTLTEERGAIQGQLEDLEEQRRDNERQFDKRRELTETMVFLQDRFERYCARLEEDGIK